MGRTQKSIKEKLDLDSTELKREPIINKNETLSHPATKIIITGITIYGFKSL